MNVHYRYDHHRLSHTHAYLWPEIERVISSREWPSRRAFDLGCGNGSTCEALAAAGFDAMGVDPSPSGVTLAQQHGINALVGDAYSDLAAVHGQFPLVTSLEVIEHCIDPRAFARTFLSMIEPGGVGILSTPYHGYWKNLALALAGKMDAHFTALWDGGHIKFFSIKTLDALLRECGAKDVRFVRVGRIPPLAMSMIAVVAAA